MRRIVLLLLIALTLSIPVSASELDRELYEATEADTLSDGLTEEQQELMGDTSLTESTDFFSSVQSLFSKALLHSGGALQTAVSTAAMVLAVCLACGLCGTAEPSAPVRSVTMAGLLAITALCTGGLNSLIRLGAETIQNLSAYAQLLLPVLSAASITSGALTSAPALYAITVLFSDLLLSIITNILIPLLYGFLAMALADCLIGTSALKRFRELLSWIVRTVLKTILYVFTGFLAITQVISGTADAMSAKAAKLTISGMVPVVGSIISDASETVLVSASLLKNSLGVFGMLAVLSICILPFIKIGIHYLLMKMTAAIAGTIAQDSLVSMLDAISEALGLLLAMTGACALILLISTVCSLKVVGY